MKLSATLPDSNNARRRGAVKLVTLVISAVLLYLLYRSVDLAAVGRVLRRADPFWLVVSIGLIAPITVVRAMRFKWLLPPGTLSGVREATELMLVASAFNMFLPAKAGDFAKSIIVARRGSTSGGIAASAVVYERLSDLLGMVVWALLGVLLVRPVAPLLPRGFWVALALVGVLCACLILSEAAANRLLAMARPLLSAPRLARVRNLAEGWPALIVQLRGRRLGLALWSIGLWLLQLTQIWLFAVALNASIPLAVCASLSAVALLASQVPITIGGIGTRDIALVLLLSPYMTPEEAAAIGILTASRNLLPPLVALPILGRYIAMSAPGERSQGESPA